MATKLPKVPKGEERFEIVYEQSPSMVYSQIWVDKQTGVNYLYIAQGYGAGLTPLLDSDGSVIVTPITKE